MASAARDVLLTEQLAEVDSEFAIDLSEIDLGPRLREVDEVWAEALGELMLREGQRVPVDIARNPKTDRWQLHGAGGHRLVGAARVGMECVKAKVHAWDPDAAEMREIADNLHRRDLDPYDRALLALGAWWLLVPPHSRSCVLDRSAGACRSYPRARWCGAVRHRLLWERRFGDRGAARGRGKLSIPQSSEGR